MSKSRQEVEVGHFLYADGEQSGPHTHDQHQLSYARSGLLTVAVDESRWIVPPLRAVWIPSGVEHNLIAHGPTDVCPVYLSPQLGPRHLEDVAVVSVGALLRELIEALQRPGHLEDAERHHIEGLLVLQLKRLSTTPLKLPTLHEPRLAEIQRALIDDPSDRRTLREWGDFCGASERTLSRLFATETATTFGQWRNQLRLQQALISLAVGKSVTATAIDCGYWSTSAFIESFHSALGTTPGRFFKGPNP